MEKEVLSIVKLYSVYSIVKAKINAEYPRAACSSQMRFKSEPYRCELWAFQVLPSEGRAGRWAKMESELSSQCRGLRMR